MPRAFEIVTRSLHARVGSPNFSEPAIRSGVCFTKISETTRGFNDQRYFNKYVSFIGLYMRVIVFFNRSFGTFRAYPRAVTIEWEAPSVEKSIFPYYARACSWQCRGKKTSKKKKGRIDRRNRHVHYALLYGRALLSLYDSPRGSSSFGDLFLSFFSLDEYTSGWKQRVADRWKKRRETERVEKIEKDGGRKREM